MSSAGLIWKSFGKEIVEKLLKFMVEEEKNVKELPSDLKNP